MPPLARRPRSDCPGPQNGICPEGFAVEPYPCWNCQGAGCRWCHDTGQMDACKRCRGLESLFLNMVKVIAQNRMGCWDPDERRPRKVNGKPLIPWRDESWKRLEAELR